MHGSIFILLHRQQQMNPTLKLQPVNSIPSLTNSNFHLAHIYFFQTKNLYDMPNDSYPNFSEVHFRMDNVLLGLYVIVYYSI